LLSTGGATHHDLNPLPTDRERSNFTIPSWPNPAPDPSAPSVKALRFAPINAQTAALTARTVRRFSPPRRDLLFICDFPPRL
jgi:hypothetical protein